MATITVVCPKCKKGLNAPDAVAGKKIKCRSCQEVFLATPQTAPAGAAAANAPKKEDEEWGVIQAYTMNIPKEKPRCPHCAWELDQEDDVICLHCGYNLMTRQRHEQRIIEQHTGGDYFMWWTPPVLCMLLALSGFVGFYWVWWMWDFDWGQPWTEAMKVYLTVMIIAVMYLSSKFALKRMIFHPHPPEEEIAIDPTKSSEGRIRKKVRVGKLSVNLHANVEEFVRKAQGNNACGMLVSIENFNAVVANVIEAHPGGKEWAAYYFGSGPGALPPICPECGDFTFTDGKQSDKYERKCPECDSKMALMVYVPDQQIRSLMGI
jgi:DNA-directed RNA polymerase subunit M/transcription elongation factor TFIIS